VVAHQPGIVRVASSSADAVPARGFSDAYQRQGAEGSCGGAQRRGDSPLLQARDGMRNRAADHTGMARVRRVRRWPPSKLATSTAAAWSSGSSTARVARTARNAVRPKLWNPRAPYCEIGQAQLSGVPWPFEGRSADRHRDVAGGLPGGRTQEDRGKRSPFPHVWPKLRHASARSRHRPSAIIQVLAGPWAVRHDGVYTAVRPMSSPHPQPRGIACNLSVNTAPPEREACTHTGGWRTSSGGGGPPRPGGAYRDAHVGPLSRRVSAGSWRCRNMSVRQALGGSCRHSANGLGGLRIAYNSCRNRHCPEVPRVGARPEWLADRQSEMLPVTTSTSVFPGCRRESPRERSLSTISRRLCILFTAAAGDAARHRCRSQASRRRDRVGAVLTHGRQHNLASSSPCPLVTAGRGQSARQDPLDRLPPGTFCR